MSDTMQEALKKFKEEFKEELAVIREKYVSNRRKSLWDTWPCEEFNYLFPNNLKKDNDEK